MNYDLKANTQPRGYIQQQTTKGTQRQEDTQNAEFK